MTEGRFETLHNLRPGGWDTRRHWAKVHQPVAADVYHVQDHMERESCPFHDLRADGCFQPEYGGLGVEGANFRPQDIVKRPAGNAFSAGSLGVQPRERGVGGLPVPLDTEPGDHQNAVKARSGRPWTATGESKGLFSVHPYMSAETIPRDVAPVPKFFNTGKAALIGSPTKHHPSPYQEPRPYGRPAFRLSAGSVQRKPDPAPPVLPPEPTAPKTKRSQSAPRRPYVAPVTSFGTFSRYPEYIAQPYSEASLRSERRPIFTYAAKTKRSMPIAAPWKTGVTSSEPVKVQGGALHAARQLVASASMRGRSHQQGPAAELLRSQS